jgi:CubicO group peptidase (beta-lactamase class C family)
MNIVNCLTCLSLSASLAALAAQPFPASTPEAVGMSTERLQRVDQFIERLQRENKLAGAVTLIARRGKVVSLKAHGFADLEGRRAMRVDDLFQLQSMTKPIAAVVTLQLMEEGRLQLSDPVAKFLPEFADMLVAVARPDASGSFDLVPVSRPITILDLMTHRAGFTGGLPPRDSPAERLRREAEKTLPPNENYTLEQYVKHLAASPLDVQPGTAFRYGPATTVLGRVIEVVSGQTLDAAFRERVFQPLGMTDTFFSVPEAKRARVALPYALNPHQGLTRLPLDAMNPRFLSAGGNLFGTAMDYLRFCQMLLNNGELHGTRVLSRESVELMTASQVDPIPTRFLPGHYFGLGVAVRKADGQVGLLGSPGTYGWSGGYNTYFRVDPLKQLVILLFTQLEFSPFELELQHGFHNTAMQAVSD